jgi:predicted acyltransferase
MELNQKIADRVISVDVLRGFAMFIILSTQIGGAPIFRTFNNMVYGQAWPEIVKVIMSNPAISIANVAQPMFVFVVGVVLPFSLKKRLLKNGKRKVYTHVVVRSVILFICGLIAGGKLLNMQFDKVYWYNNVLEYISISYLVCSFIVINTPKKAHYIIAGSLLLIYWCVWLFIPAPGWDGDIFSQEMNIGIYIDQVVLGSHGHPFKGWTAVINSVGHIIQVLLGVLAGHVIFGKKDKTEKTKNLLLIGIVMVVAGLIWSLVYPVIGRNWSSSFALVTAGISTLLLALLYHVIDVKGYIKWSFFFFIFGVNSIAIYMMAHTFDFRHIGNVVVGGSDRHPFGISGYFPEDVRLFIQALAAMAVMWLIMYYMYRKKTFIKI